MFCSDVNIFSRMVCHVIHSKDPSNEYSVAKFLKGLLLEDTKTYDKHPFIVEFCLMYPFRVHQKTGKITMISCSAVGSVVSKMISICKAGVSSCMIQMNNREYSPRLVQQIRDCDVNHTLCPMVRQLREMTRRLPTRRVTSVDDKTGKIVIEQFAFDYNRWSKIVPTALDMMQAAVQSLAVGDWWKSVVDVTKSINVRTCPRTAELTLVGVEPHWKDVDQKNLPLDSIDRFTAVLELAFHGFGGGGARMTELKNPTMFFCVFRLGGEFD